MVPRNSVVVAFPLLLFGMLAVISQFVSSNLTRSDLLCLSPLPHFIRNKKPPPYNIRRFVSSLTFRIALQDHYARVGYVRPCPSLVLIDAREHGGSERSLPQGKGKFEFPSFKNVVFSFFSFFCPVQRQRGFNSCATHHIERARRTATKLAGATRETVQFLIYWRCKVPTTDACARNARVVRVHMCVFFRWVGGAK